MAARTAAQAGLKTVLVERKQDVTEIKRLCTQLLRLGSGGFSSDKVPTDKTINQVSLTFETDFKESLLHLANIGTSVRYRGCLRQYHNEAWVSPGGNVVTTLPTDDWTYGYCIDKSALLASLLEDSVKAGCEVRSGNKCSQVISERDNVRCVVSSEAGTTDLVGRRVVIADGAFSPLLENLGFNQGRVGPPPLKFLMYLLDRIDVPFLESRFIKMAVPSIHKGQISLGLWPRAGYQLEISVPIGAPESLPELLDRIMRESPFAPWFKNSKVVNRMACNMALTPNVPDPARGNIMCIGDNAAYAETAIKGALGCGYIAGKAVKMSLEGQDGNKYYNDWWDQAFYSHSPQYRSFGRRAMPTARVLSDSETDTLYKWLSDKNIHGMVNDVVPDRLPELRAELPGIAAKLAMPVAARG